jgi:hypothetical protein
MSPEASNGDEVTGSAGELPTSSEASDPATAAEPASWQLPPSSLQPFSSQPSDPPTETIVAVDPGGSASPAPAKRPPLLRRIAPPALCVTVYTVLAGLVYGLHPPATSVTLPPCACGDISSQVWFVAWPAYALTHGLNPLYSSWVDYPHGVNLMNNTAAPLLGILFAPFTARYGAVATFSLLMRLAFALSGISMCFVLRRWTRWWPAAFLGGLLYEFSPFMVGQSQSHLFLTFVPLPPIMVALFDALVVRRTHVIRNGILLGVVIAAQLMISAEVLAMGLLAAVCALVVLAIRHPVAAREAMKEISRGLAAGVATFVVAAGYPIYVYFLGPYHVSGPPHPVAELDQYHSFLGSLIYPTSLQRFGFGSWLAKGMRLVAGNGVEHTTYVGVPLLCVLAFILIRCRRSGYVQTFALVAVSAWVVTLGRGKGHVRLPYDLLVRLPIINGALDLRYSLLMYLGMSVVLAIGLEAMRREGIFTGILRLPRTTRAGGRIDASPAGGAATGSSPSPRPELRRACACLGIAAVGLLPLLPALPYTSTTVVVPTLFTAADSPVATGDVVLSFPLAISYEGPFDQALLWQSVARMRFKLIAFRGAVAGPNHQPIRGANLLLPPDQAENVLSWGLYGEPSPPPTGPATSEAIRQFLKNYGVDAVTIVPSSTRTAAVIAYFQAALGVAPVAFEGSFVWSHVKANLAAVASSTHV